MKSNWLYENSFPLVLFLVPLIMVYEGFQLWLPPEQRNQKPTTQQFTVGMSLALAGWVVLTFFCSFLWAFSMKLVYGSAWVRQRLDAEAANSGQSANPIEKLFRVVCYLAL